MNTEQLDKYEEILQEGLVKLCTAAGYLDGQMLESDDINHKWDEYITDYVADAIKNIEEYTQAALAWPAFLGMGVAWNWDHDWIVGARLPYAAYYGEEGWDDMDENILYNIYGYEREGKEVNHLVETYLSCADAVIALIRHEGIQVDTEEGFYTLVRSFGVMYKIGAAIALKNSGYKRVPVKFS